jgi:hypothetical protein
MWIIYQQIADQTIAFYHFYSYVCTNIFIMPAQI